jgi:hypothetical protein
VGLAGEVTPEFETAPYYSLAAAGSDLWIGTDTGEVLRRVGGAWNIGYIDGTRVRALFATGPTNVWAGNSNGIWSSNDGDNWTLVPASAGETVNDLWGLSGQPLAAAGNGHLYTNNGGTWTDHTGGVVASGGNWYGVWGTAANNVYAVGDNYHIVHWNGTTWTRVVLPLVTPADSSGTSFRAIDGSGVNDIWVVGAGGWAYHYNGTSWIDRSVSAPLGPFFGQVASVGTGDAMVGSESGIYVAVPQRLTRASDLRVSGDRGLARVGTTIWAAGQSQLFRGTR